MERKHSIVSLIFLGSLLLLGLSACTGTDNLPQKPSLPARFVTAKPLFAVCSPDSKNIWVGGYMPFILHSADGGKSWNKQGIGTVADICSIFFVTTLKGLAVGKAGAILQTADGGETWTAQRSPTTNHLFSVYFSDENHGWAVGYSATVLHTDDGGKTWKNQSPNLRGPLDAQLERDRAYLLLKPKEPTLNAIFAVDPWHVWIAGEYGTLLYSADSGSTWETRECREIYPVLSEKEWLSPVPSLYSLWFKDNASGWAVGMDGIIIHTADGGKSWRKLESPLAAEKPTLYKVKVIGNRGWAVGQYGEYMCSTDGGMTWKKMTGSLMTRYWIRDLDFSDALHGIAVGEHGTIVRSEDGGQTWEMVSGIPLKQSDF
jgi:photosystem II stability/assembly factor-like uncharacterized protein